MSGAVASLPPHDVARRRRGRATRLVPGCALVLLLVASGATADDAERAQRFERANAAFAAGEFAAARTGFAEILASDGPSAAALYNLGNACFRAGLVGEAVLSYERALLLAPRDQDVRANLRQVRKAASLPEAEDGVWTRFVRLLTTNGWAWLASAALYLVCAALLALRLTRERGVRTQPRSGGLRIAIAAGGTLLVVAAGACVTRLGERDRAVVLGTDPTLRVAPYASATASSELAPGEIVRIERTHDGFTLIRTAAGKSGWTSNGAIARIAGRVP